MGSGKKSALVTGSSTGIGRGIAIGLAKEGYDVAVHYFGSKEDAESVAAIIRETGSRCVILHGNMEDPSVPARLVEEAVASFGKLDLLVNNAGITQFQKLLDMELESVNKLFSLNFRGMLLAAQAAAKHMVSAGVKGTILCNTSIRGSKAHPGDAVYGGLKAGMNRVVETLALELAPYGIRVNAFAPGITDISKGELSETSGYYRFMSNARRFVPLRRIGKPEDMANAVVWLASDKASYITGEVIRIDGGLSVISAAESDEDLAEIIEKPQI